MIRWVEWEWVFGVPAEHHPLLVERLRGTPARLESRLRGLAPDVLIRRIGDEWSIQEHAGHLVDLEELFAGRLDDYERRRETLRPADMSNRRTEDARHNDRPIRGILEDLARERGALVSRLEALPDAAFARRSHHPRLNRPVSLVDMLYFQAEHDDHHLASITARIKALA